MRVSLRNILIAGGVVLSGIAGYFSLQDSEIKKPVPVETQLESKVEQSEIYNSTKRVVVKKRLLQMVHENWGKDGNIDSPIRDGKDLPDILAVLSEPEIFAEGYYGEVGALLLDFCQQTNNGNSTLTTDLEIQRVFTKIMDQRYEIWSRLTSIEAEHIPEKQRCPEYLEKLGENDKLRRLAASELNNSCYKFDNFAERVLYECNKAMYEKMPCHYGNMDAMVAKTRAGVLNAETAEDVSMALNVCDTNPLGVRFKIYEIAEGADSDLKDKLKLLEEKDKETTEKPKIEVSSLTPMGPYDQFTTLGYPKPELYDPYETGDKSNNSFNQCDPPYIPNNCFNE